MTDSVTRRNLLTHGGALVAAGLAAAATGRVLGAAEPPAANPLPAAGLKNSLQSPSYPEGAHHHLATEAIVAGEDSGCSAYPIYQGTNNQNGNYSRRNNPTVDSVEVKIKQLEGAEYGIATGCGMAAISSTLFSLLRPGKRIIHHRTLYGGTSELLGRLREWNITVDAIDMSDPEQLRRALATGPTAVVYTEVHSNHLLEVIDVRAVAELTHNAGALLVIDNTFLTPYLFHPLALGADIVLHSATKYLMGHGNGLAGIVCGRKELLVKIEDTRLHHGTVLAPSNAALLHQGIKTLPLRMERHCANAMQVAEFLTTHRKVTRVLYPGLPTHPNHAVAKKQVRGFGGMVGIEVANNVGNVWEKLKHVKPWWSLGDAESLMPPCFFNGLTPGSRYLRISVGLEHADDVIADLSQALDAS